MNRISKYTPRGHALSARRSTAGIGLFAGEEIQKGVCVIEYTGRILAGKEADEGGGKYLFEVSPRKTIDGNVRTNPARYINHSCRPNCEAVIHGGRVFIFSRKRIAPGTELTYDYGKEYFDEYIGPKGCRCKKHRTLL